MDRISLWALAVVEAESGLVRSHRAPIRTVSTCSKTRSSDSQVIRQHTMRQLSCQGLEAPEKDLALGELRRLVMIYDGKSSLATFCYRLFTKFLPLKLCFHILCNLSLYIEWLEELSNHCQTILLIKTFRFSESTNCITLLHTMREDSESLRVIYTHRSPNALETNWTLRV